MLQNLSNDVGAEVQQDGEFVWMEWDGGLCDLPTPAATLNLEEYCIGLEDTFKCFLRAADMPTLELLADVHGQSPAACHQAEMAWMCWKAGLLGDVSWADGILEYAKDHEELKGAFILNERDADRLYPGWKDKLGC